MAEKDRRLPRYGRVSNPPLMPIFSRAAFTLRQAQGTAYNGDGQRVKSVMTTNLGTTATYFVGAHYEVTDGGTVTKYYYAGSQRIAMRNDGILYFMLGDHLGSTSLVTDASGNIVSELRYKAWGEVRYASGNMPTKYSYTGQYSYQSDFGLMFYNARWYDSSLSRFAQADSIVPGGVQGLDRYAAMNNNPVRYIDPSGHRACDDIDSYGNCVSEPKIKRHETWVTFSKDDGAPDWTDADKQIVEQGAKDIGRQLLAMWRSEMRYLYRSGDISSMPDRPSARELYLDVFGVVDFHRLNSTDCKCWGQFHSTSQIYIYAHAIITAPFAGTRFIVHELGHVFDNLYGLNPRNAVASAWREGAQSPLPYRSNDPGKSYGGFAGPFEGWQQSEGTDTWEEFADMFVGWTYGQWWSGDGNAGRQRANFMDYYMPMWVNLAGK